jgi:RNA polymerase sigma-70 factor (ECF subfamily)
MGSAIAEVPVDGMDARLAHLRPEDIRIDLSRAIQSLPGHYREVILLRDIEEMSIDEIAAVLGLTRESVKARIHRARMLIREYLIRD